MDAFATSPLQFVWQLWTMKLVWCANTSHQSLPSIQLAKHEMTVEAVWGAACDNDAAGDSIPDLCVNVCQLDETLERERGRNKNTLLQLLVTQPKQERKISKWDVKAEYLHMERKTKVSTHLL